MVIVKVENMKEIIDNVSGGSNKLEQDSPNDQLSNVEELKAKEENSDSQECSSFEEYYEVDAKLTTTITNEESLNTLNQQLIKLSYLEKTWIKKQMTEFRTKENMIETLFEAVSKETEQKSALLNDIEAKNAMIFSLENQLNIAQLKQSKEEKLNENYRKHIGEKLEKIFDLEKKMSDLSFQLTMMKKSKTIEIKPSDVKHVLDKKKQGNTINKVKKLQYLQYDRHFLLNLRNDPMSKNCPDDLPDLESYKMKPKSTSHSSNPTLKHNEIDRNSIQHNRKRKGDETLEGLKKERKLSSPGCCDICSFFSYRKGEIKKHKLEMHLDTFISCEDCGKLLANNQGLARHKKQNHPEY